MRVTRPNRGLPNETDAALDLISSDDRAWLLRLCAHLSRDADVAEDLAQETLIEAWRHLERLREPDQLRPWLTGIARNVYLRWSRQRAREAGRRLFATTDQSGGGLLEQIPNNDAQTFDLELERQELATLLDRALGLLPVESRDLLIQHYIQESSQAEIAERLGLSQGALAVRLHRGRLSLRRVLADTMADELAASGITVPDDAYWHPTPLWCRYCGAHKLLARIHPDRMLVLRCPNCCRSHGEAHSEAQLPATYRVTKGYKTLYRSMLGQSHAETRAWLSGSPGTCPSCGTPLRVRLGALLASPLVGGHWGVQRHCPNSRCAVSEPNGVALDSTTLATMNLGSPEGRRFWQKHSHLLALPEREIEHQGVPAILVSFQDMESAARLDVISSRDSFETLGIHRVHAS